MSILIFAVSLQNMKLSIVIPVYRVENTLDRCVESVLNQKYDNLEIILVNDGSPDRCPQMCDEWAKHDQRISVIHKENGGLSDARNAGIEQATGDYITFVDSDDYLEPDTDTYPVLMQILAAHPEYDLLEFPCTTTQLCSHVYTDMNDYWLEGEAYRHTYAWNKIYRRQIFDHLRFPVGKVFEDVYTLPKILALCKTVATTDKGMYHYEPGGISKDPSHHIVSQLLDAQIIMLEKFKPEDNPAIRNYYLQILNTQMETYGKGGDVTLKPFWGKLWFSNAYTWKCNMKILLYNILGIKRLCQIYKVLNQLILHRW